MEQKKDVFISYKDNDEGDSFAAELKKALEIGADKVINSRKEDAVARIKENLFLIIQSIYK